MADEEAELDRSPEKGSDEAVLELRERLKNLEDALRQSSESTIQSSAIYCQEFCRVSYFLSGI